MITVSLGNGATLEIANTQRESLVTLRTRFGEVAIASTEGGKRQEALSIAESILTEALKALATERKMMGDG